MAVSTRPKIVIDLDQTLTLGCEAGDYANAKPNLDVVATLKSYREKGFEVIIATARNMRTHDGNIGKINAFTLPVIMEWLQAHDIPFDEVHVGKPWCGKGGFYVDDKAIRPNEFIDKSYEEIAVLIGDREPVLIITSAAYVGDEIVAEFGMLPPSFLPIGNRRLYQWQVIHYRKNCDRIVLTMPNGFKPPQRDRVALDALGVELLPVPAGISLGQSLIYTLNMLGLHDDEVDILHGDTFISNMDVTKPNAISIHVAKDAYRWAIFHPDKKERFKNLEECEVGFLSAAVVSGYFRFSSARVFLKCLAKTQGGFIDAINLYDQEERLNIIEVGHWLDFGHLQTFYQSRKYMTTERFFNNLVIEKGIVSKSSENEHKIIAEASWFENIPLALRPFCPAYYGRGVETGCQVYHTENMLLAALNELFVFGQLGFGVWQGIFKSVSDFLQVARDVETPRFDTTSIQHLYGEKTYLRLQDFCSVEGLSLEQPWLLNGNAVPPLSSIVDEALSCIISNEPISAVMHGDLCFSNIFYDYRAETIKVIDPRGTLDGSHKTVYGDQRYDIAKLYHSVYGLYDFIVGGFYWVDRPSNYELVFELADVENIGQAQQAFAQMFVGTSLSAYSKQIKAINVLLFLSMLPLHADDRQRQWALLANAFRLYLDFDRDKPVKKMSEDQHEETL